MITESDIEKALTWLVENANTAAQARANRIYLEEYTKVVLSDAMNLSGQSSVSAQEKEARSSTAYRDHLLALREAVEQDEKIRWLGRAAEAKIEAWRSLQANYRAQGKI